MNSTSTKLQSEFIQPGPSGIRAKNRALASQTWQSVHTLKQLVEANEIILGHYEFNTTAILNRFTTVLNGIGWFSGIFYQSVRGHSHHIEFCSSSVLLLLAIG